MTENQAQILNAIVGVSIGVAFFWLLGTLEVAEQFLLIEAMLTIVIPAFMVGVIARHYERKEIEREEAEGRGRAPGD
jgi:high-affinity Fe2+/Pb2+ permease